MRDVSTVRLYLLRATYLLIAVGLGLQIWPLILQGSHGVDHMRGVVRSLLGAVALLAVFGVRYPLKMLPLLLFELVWKSIWVVAIGLPLWLSHGFDAGTRETWNDCLFGIVLVALVLPWRYALTQYALLPGDRWTRRVAPAAPPTASIGTNPAA
jgi:hypothetical protein